MFFSGFGVPRGQRSTEVCGSDEAIGFIILFGIFGLRSAYVFGAGSSNESLRLPVCEQIAGWVFCICVYLGEGGISFA